jgi:cell division protein FtsW
MSALAKKLELAPRQSAAVVLACAFLLCMIGLAILLSISLVPYLRSDAPIVSLHATRQAFWLVASAAVCAFVARIDYHRLLRASRAMLVAVWIGLVCTLLFGSKQLGASRWLEVGPVNLQVSEFAKLVVILWCGWHVAKHRGDFDRYWTGFVPAIAWLGATVLLIAGAPDLGTSLFILATGMLLLYLGGLRVTHIVPTAAILMPIYGWWMLSQNGYIRARLSSHAEGGHEHVRTALRAIGSGGLLGVGLGDGRAHLGFVRMIHNDFIFAAIGEQCGLAGTLLIVFLFVVILWNGLKITMAAPDTAGFIVAFGITFAVVFQAAINMAVVTKLVPPKGIGLPFVSYGGSSLLMFGAMLGVLANVASQGRPGGALADDDAALGLDSQSEVAGGGGAGWGGAAACSYSADAPEGGLRPILDHGHRHGAR